jgi:hypothetical protein
MAGMESLGRLCNVIPVAAGAAFKVRGASVAQITVTGNDTFTVQQSSSFGGSYTPVNVIKNVYWTTANNGTAAWNKVAYVNGATPLSAITLNSSGAGTPAAMVNATCAVFHVFTSELSDPNDYLKITVGASGLVQVYLGDLVTQRGPASLEILGA